MQIVRTFCSREFSSLCFPRIPSNSCTFRPHFRRPSFSNSCVLTLFQLHSHSFPTIQKISFFTFSFLHLNSGDPTQQEIENKKIHNNQTKPFECWACTARADKYSFFCTECKRVQPPCPQCDFFLFFGLYELNSIKNHSK
jgi:hypothetical protein